MDKIAFLKSSVYYAICELSDAQSNLQDIFRQTDNEYVNGTVSVIYSVLEVAIDNLKKLEI